MIPKTKYTKNPSQNGPITYLLTIYKFLTRRTERIQARSHGLELIVRLTNDKIIHFNGPDIKFVDKPNKSTELSDK